jgi:hypothetical protein
MKKNCPNNHFFGFIAKGDMMNIVSSYPFSIIKSTILFPSIRIPSSLANRKNGYINKNK